MVQIPPLLTQLGSFRPVSSNWTQNSDTRQGVLKNLESFISAVLGLITVVAGIYFIVNFLLAALSWTTAGGDSGKVSAARDRMIQSTIGLIVVVGGYAIVGLIGAVVGLDILNPASTLDQIIP
jgi:hypothetical protein